MKDIAFFIKYLYTYTERKMIVALSGIILISLLEGAGTLLLVPLLSVAGIVDAPAGTLSKLMDLLALPQGSKLVSLTFVLAFFVLVVALQNALQRRFALYNLKVRQSYTMWLRTGLYDALLRAGWSFHIRKRRSDLAHMLTADCTRVGLGVDVSLQFLASLAFTLIQLGVAFWLSPRLTAMILVCGAGLAFLSRKHIQRSKQLGGRSLAVAMSLLAGITDQLNGMKEIKSNTLEASRLTWMNEMNRAVNEEQLEDQRLVTSSQLIYNLSAAAFIAVFVWLFYSQLHAQPGQLLLIILIFSRLWPRFLGIQSTLEKIASSVPALKAVLAMRKECEEERESGASAYGAEGRIVLRRGIELRDVHFTYRSDQSVYALRNINARIPFNRMTAIVGRSGAGKSTLIDLIMGLLEPDRGELLLDDKPISRDQLLRWRSSISYVPQDPYLFDGSVRENLLLVEPDAEEERIWRALAEASAEEFVRKLPQGLDTRVGDRGIRLSGGERQRLVLARALLRQPSILILDEATSSLDTENESRIQEAIRRMKGKMTIIVVAHRLSTIRHADQIIVLDQGRIVQAGQYSQLAAERKGVFSNLLGYQLADVE